MQEETKNSETLTGQIRNIAIDKYKDFPVEKRNTVLTIRDRLGFEGYKLRIQTFKEKGIVRVYKLTNPITIKSE